MAIDCQIPQYACSVDLSMSELNARSATLAEQQYRPTQVVAYADGGGASRYAAIWMRDLRSSLTQVVLNQTASEYQDGFDDRNRDGYRLMCVSAAGSGDSHRYAGLWEDGGWRGYHARHGLSASEYQAEFDAMAADGYRLVWVNGSATPSTSSYAAIWSRFADPDRHARHNLPIEQYQDVFDQMKADGYRVAHFSAHRVRSQTLVAAIWRKGTSDFDPHARHDLTRCELENELERLAWEDWRPICLAGYAVADGTRYAGIWVKNARTRTVQGRAGSGLEIVEDSIRSIMAASRVTAASVAISRNGKLVLAKGLAESAEGEEPVSATSIFRVASVSKTLTGAAIVRAIQDEKLAFGDKLLDVLGWQDAVKDPDLRDVTVDHLLHHRGGWHVDGNDSAYSDPMLEDTKIARSLKVALPITRQSIFRWTTTERELHTRPGDAFDYSNYGYMLLGMILERVTGERYEDYVARTLLAPLGIRRMRCAQSLFTGRFPGEVTYHHPHTKLYASVMHPADAQVETMQMYGSLNFVNMAAHGSWVASAVDLVRFASALDDPKTCPILSASSVKTLLTRTQPATSSYDYACGWRVHHGTGETYHGGNFNGTGALLYRHPEGTDIAIVFNRSTDETFRVPCDKAAMEAPTPHVWDLMDLARSWVDGIRRWPAIDMWSEYF